MKRKLMTLVAALAICLATQEAKAQTDGYFDLTGNNGGMEDIMPALPTGHGLDDNSNANAAPLGDGLLAFIVLGSGYAAAKRRNRQD